MNFDSFVDYFDSQLLRTAENLKAGNANKRLLLHQIVVQRMMCRNVLALINGARTEIRKLERSKRISESKGITYIFAKAHIEKEMIRERKLEDVLVVCADRLMALLDLWQERGATLADLCNLCNRDYKQVLTEIEDEDVSKPFSEIAYIYCLDYKNDTDWLEDDIDAPLTHSIRYFYRHHLLYNKGLKEHSWNCFVEAFPEAVRFIRDNEFGENRLYDLDGNDLGEIMS